MSSEKVLRVRVSLKGRPVRSYSFTKGLITLGRDPEADIFLDNPGISREHLRIERSTAGQYTLHDLGSANGTLLNDVKVERGKLAENDVVRIGKYSLWVSFDQDRRGDAESARRAIPASDDGTTVLSTAELTNMVDRARFSEISSSEPDAEPAHATAPRAAGRDYLLQPAAVLAFAIGTLVGCGATLYVSLFFRH